MLTRKTDISMRSAYSLALLALTVLFAAVIGGLPFSHQLFHESLVEPEHCPAYLLQSGLSLLFGGRPDHHRHQNQPRRPRRFRL